MSQGNPTDKEINIYSSAIVLEGMTQSDAWRKAYHKSIAKPEVVHVRASRMNSMDRVQVRIKEKRLEQIKKDKEIFESGLDDQVMTKQELARILTKQRKIKMTDVADFKNVQMPDDKKGNKVWVTRWIIKNAEDIDPEIAMMIKSVTSTKLGPKIELHDATAAGRQLTELMGWNAPKSVDLTSKDGSMTPAQGMTNEELAEEMKKYGLEQD